jgi:hypothetical protein
MHACTERPTPTQIAATLSKISKKHVDTSHLSTEHFYSEAHQVGVGLNWAHYRSYMEGYVSFQIESGKILMGETGWPSGTLSSANMSCLISGASSSGLRRVRSLRRYLHEDAAYLWAKDL